MASTSKNTLTPSKILNRIFDDEDDDEIPNVDSDVSQGEESDHDFQIHSGDKDDGDDDGDDGDGGW